MITNWAGNVGFTPCAYYMPKDDQEVLTILSKHRNVPIRVVGSLHSMNDIAQTDSVIIRMQHFNRVRIEYSHPSIAPKGSVQQGVDRLVTAGAGTVLEDLQDRLEDVGATLPSRGTIKKQTIAGAISTGTHGSGRSSLSHYVMEIRAAAYDPHGEPKIFVYNQGDKLRAARTALGTMGVILDVKFRPLQRFFIEESLEHAESLEEVLSKESQFPMQLFVRFPYSWGYYISRRRIALRGPEGVRENLSRHWRRTTNLLLNDRLLPLLIKHVVASRDGSSAFVKRFYEQILPRMISKKKPIIDDDDHVQTMHHEFPKNQDTELLIPESHFREADEWLRHMISAFADSTYQLPQWVEKGLEQSGLAEAFRSRTWSYTHHGPLFYQRVMPDDTLISLTAGATEPYYSIIILSYLGPESSETFYKFAEFLSLGLVRLYQGRPHWGKLFPLTHKDIGPLYPGLGRFREITRQVDPNGVFRNDFTRRVLGF